MAPIFRALGDPGRRVLLDRLFERDGQTLGELCEALPAMTRFGVMKHLGVLEEAGLLTTQRVGREKRHFLNPVPIRLVHDRWIGKFAEPVVGSMTALKHHLEAPMDTVDHVYAIEIKASPDRVWRAITDGDDTVRYYFDTRVASDWTPGSPLVYTYAGRLGRRRRRGHRDRRRASGRDGFPAALGSAAPDMDPGPDDVAGRGRRGAPGRPADGDVRARARVDAIEADFTGGIVHIVSGLKTLLETGAPLVAA